MKASRQAASQAQQLERIEKKLDALLKAQGISVDVETPAEPIKPRKYGIDGVANANQAFQELKPVEPESKTPDEGKGTKKPKARTPDPDAEPEE